MPVLTQLNLNVGTEQNPNMVLHDINDKRISTTAVTTATHLLTCNSSVTSIAPITAANLASVLGVKDIGFKYVNQRVDTTGISIPCKSAIVIAGNNSGTQSKSLFFKMRSVVTELVDGGGQIKTDTSSYVQISGDDNNVIFKATSGEKTVHAQLYGFLG